MDGLFRITLLSAVILFAFAPGAQPLGQGPQTLISVSTPNDTLNPTDGKCSLREAVIAANSNTESGLVSGECDAGSSSSLDVIHLPIDTYQLSRDSVDDNAQGGDLDITESVYIFGTVNGMYQTVIDMGIIDRVFHVLSSSTLYLEQLTVRDGRLIASTSYGAGVKVESGCSLDLSNTYFYNNKIIGTGGTKKGGAIYLGGTGTLAADYSHFHDNEGYLGGAIYAENTSTIKRSLFTENSSFDGSGIYNWGTLTVENSTFSGNFASYTGAAIYNKSSLTLNFSTLVGNQANAFAGIGGGAGATNQVNATILAHNTVDPGITTDRNCTPYASYTGSYNLEDDDSCPFVGSGNIYNTLPILLPLGDYGGKTSTYALSYRSPAIDSYYGGSCLSWDQRHVSRPKDGDGNGSEICDRGAFEADKFYDVIYVPLVMK